MSSATLTPAGSDRESALSPSASAADSSPEFLAETGPEALERPQLRLVVAGSVDDGKSTLVGRLLYDTKSILSDQYDAIEAASKRRGSEQVDLALLTDGLRAEREQGITIDVAYRYFSTPRRSFILADTPGHTQYTRNTVTGASTAEAALILVDARNGVLVQTRRHAAVMALLQVPHVIVAVNKMDAVGWDQARYDELAADVRALGAGVGLDDVRVIPVSALTGQNVASRGDDVAGHWYDGPTLLEMLETLDVSRDDTAKPFRLPVQLVLRPRTADFPDYRGLAGRISSGTLSVGDEIVALPSGLSSVVTGIDTPTGSVASASAGDSVTVLLRDELDVGRGQVLINASSGANERPRVLDHVVGVLCWLDERPSTPGQRLLVKVGTNVVRGLLTSVDEHWDVDTQQWLASTGPAALNDIARVTVRVAEQVAVDEYADHRVTGGFLLIDPAGGATLAAGMVGDPLARAFDPSI
jgi:sulfate adenylyltransferase subunit 1